MTFCSALRKQVFSIAVILCAFSCLFASELKRRFSLADKKIPLQRQTAEPLTHSAVSGESKPYCWHQEASDVMVMSMPLIVNCTHTAPLLAVVMFQWERRLWKGQFLLEKLGAYTVWLWLGMRQKQVCLFYYRIFVRVRFQIVVLLDCLFKS